jgi:hypothetical protein
MRNVKGMLMLVLLATMFVCNSCSNKEKNIIGKWAADLSSIDLKMGDGIPSDIKSEVEQEMSGLKSMQFVIDQVIIEFKEGGVLTLGPSGDTRDFQWKIEDHSLMLSGDLEGIKAEFSIEIKELSKDKMTLFVSAESMLNQVKKVMGSEFDEAMAEIPSDVNINDMVKGTSVAISLIKKS